MLQTSDTRAKMVEILAKFDFVTQEFILSPIQFGVPYSRPRYFCLVLSLSLSPSLVFRIFYQLFSSLGFQQYQAMTQFEKQIQFTVTLTLIQYFSYPYIVPDCP